MPLFAEQANADQVNTDLIVVNKKTNKLAYFKDGKLVKEFAVGTGKSPSLTPEGKFRIVNKIKNRPYYKEKIAGGDPRNPLGDRWIGLEVNGTQGTTYAIHGNSNENSIGKYVSAGCIRMHNDEVHWLFTQVKVNSYAIITTSDLTFEEIAVKNGYPLGSKVFEGKVIINGVEQKLKNSLEMVDSRIYIPLRECLELLGATVQWNNQNQMATISIGDRTITHKPLTDKATVNGNDITITPSRYQGTTVMLPLRNILELSGIEVVWDGQNNAIYLSN
ncbi:L,D-transpeptidase family protein [Paenibacillus sp. FA6]|uniref:L,D-transpeptidase family protein n=1 Tax=Paenibacillus sp. FA6 TaxID=3413029 RepID=UPI003F656300